MRNFMNKSVLMLSLLAVTGTFTSCSDDFLRPDPLSQFNPETVFSTVGGMEAALATCDKNLRHIYTYTSATDAAPIVTEMIFSDIAVNGTTDQPIVNNVSIDVIAQLVPDGNNDLDATNRTAFFWKEGFSGIKYANTVLENLPKISGVDPEVRDKMLGRAYFYRSFIYLNLLFQFGDVPLLTKVAAVPKLDYRSTKREVILDMITSDMEFAVEHVPAVAEKGGMITKGACRQLLIKCYLAKGEFDKAIEQANELIDNSGYALMKENFGTFINPMPVEHPITCNPIWDLHRPENKVIPENKEVIHYLVNSDEYNASKIRMNTMRNAVPFWAGGGTIGIQTPDGKIGMDISKEYFDYRKAFGRGIARLRPTWYSEHSVWLNDPTDLRHDVESGNWMVMENMKYNNPALFKENNPWAGKNIQKWDGDRLLCLDTIRNWFNWPQYKIWIETPEDEASNSYNGGAAHWYLYRLAETYLLRAEAYFWKGDLEKAAADVNEVRKRARCTKLFTAADMNMGVIMDERARELYYEELRHTELSRVSYIFAKTGKQDEFGKQYTVEGLSDDSYWFQRISKYNNYYNKGVQTRSNVFYTIAPFHIYWPIPQRDINLNIGTPLRQNKGYSGYDPNIKSIDNLQEALEEEMR